MRSTFTSPPRCLCRTSMLLLSVGLLACALAAPCPPATAQINSQVVPRDIYYRAFEPYYLGEYREAREGFREAARGGVINVDGRWVDSICYHTMMGECHYHMGELTQALEHYDAALKIQLAYKDWMLRVEFPATIAASNSTRRTRINWGVTSRKTVLGEFPDKMLTFVGRLDNERVVREGGVVEPPEFRPVRVQEVVRCSALAMRRRHDIMGPTCKYDPLTDELIHAFSRRSAPPNHWAQGWIDAQLGFAYAAAGRVPEAMATLEKAVQIAGMYDHPVTAAALLELGKLHYGLGKYDVAARFFHEATLSAAQFNQFDDMEEAFRFATITHLVTEKKGLYPPLSNAIAWTRNEGSRPLQASLLVTAAENSLAQGQTAAAGGYLVQAERIIMRNELRGSSLGARYLYQTAHVDFQRGNTAAGSTNLAAAIAFQKKGSRRLFQIGLADKLFIGGGISPRVAGRLFDDVLREPTAGDWSSDPLETFSVLLTPHPLPLEHWLELKLLDKKDQLEALEIADRIRRHRYFTTLPFGGRLLALRWILEAPKEALSDAAVLQRQALLVKYPEYAELSRQAREARDKLRRLPLAPEDEEQTKTQAKLLADFGRMSQAQELMLTDIALRREPSEFVFPPLPDAKKIQESLPERTLALAFLNTSHGLHVFMLGRDRLSHDVVSDPLSVRVAVAGLFRGMGHYDRNRILDDRQLSDESWKAPARDLLELFVEKKELVTGIFDKYDELVVVPDGLLWYVPFEALQVADGDETLPLISKVRVRYAPTLSTILPDARGHGRADRVAVVTGKLFPRDDEAIAGSAFDTIRAHLAGSERLSSKLPAPSSLVSSVCDQLIVLDEIESDGDTLYSWSPMQLDQGKPGSTLASWLALPWDGPDQIVVPGFHTPAADGLKNGGSGDEIFLNICGLMSTGTRTILLSRWRTGGQTSFDLTREFVQQLSRLPAAKAWQRSIQLTRIGDLDPEIEPRFKSTNLETIAKGDHPFFWSGYLLVDTGSDPRFREPELEEVPDAAGAAEK